MPSDPEIDAACHAIEVAVEQMVIEFVTEVVAILQETTPFATGHARANWVPQIGRPFERVDGTVRSSKKRGTYSTAGAAKQNGLAQVLSYKLAQGDVFVTNNVPYIRWLNYGKSTQAPAGFVEAAVATAVQTVMGRNAP